MRINHLEEVLEIIRVHLRNNYVIFSRLPNNWTNWYQIIESDTLRVGPTVNQRQLNPFAL